MQMFVRRRQGRENLERLMGVLRERQVPIYTHAITLKMVRAILEELEGVKREIEKLDSSTLDHRN
jgi:predicted amidohydrolase YtcJ